MTTKVTAEWFRAAVAEALKEDAPKGETIGIIAFSDDDLPKRLAPELKPGTALYELIERSLKDGEDITIRFAKPPTEQATFIQKLVAIPVRQLLPAEHSHYYEICEQMCQGFEGPRILFPSTRFCNPQQ